MKKVLIFAILSSLVTACGAKPASTVKTSLMPAEVYLAGKTYSRTFTTTPFGAHGPTLMNHSLKFLAGAKVQDNANTFFGNPPAIFSYTVKNAKVFVEESLTHEAVYSFNPEWTTLTNDETGFVLTLDNSPKQ